MNPANILEITKILLKTGFKCNQNCLFCHSSDIRNSSGLPTREVVRRIELVANSGARMVVLSGGEVTLRRDLLTLAREAAARNLLFGLITNGRVLSYPGRLEKLVEFGLAYIHISLHGASSEVHNRLVQADSHEQILKALELSCSFPIQRVVTAVVASYNLKELPVIPEIVAPFAPLVLRYFFPQFLGATMRNQAELVPRLKSAATIVFEAIENSRRIPGVDARCDGFTPCVMPEFERVDDALTDHGFIAMGEVAERSFFPVDRGPRAYAEQCGLCNRKAICPGVDPGYLEAFGVSELIPFL